MQKLIEQIDAALSHADEIGASATALWLDRARWAIGEDMLAAATLSEMAERDWKKEPN